MNASTTIAAKTCSTCRVEKLVADFYPKARGAVYSGASGFNAKCKACVKIENAARKTNGKRLLECYGLSLEQWNEMFIKQNGCCAVCLRHQTEVPKQRLQVDHNHETGKIRGLLCGPCNMAIGLFRDDTHSLSKAIQYLNGKVD